MSRRVRREISEIVALFLRDDQFACAGIALGEMLGREFLVEINKRTF